jgi:hypothetical protein
MIESLVKTVGVISKRRRRNKGAIRKVIKKQSKTREEKERIIMVR